MIAPGRCAACWVPPRCCWPPAPSTNAPGPRRASCPQCERLSARKNAMSTINSRSLCWRLLQQARPYWLHLTGIFLLSLLSSPFALLAPVPLKIAVDSILGQEPLPRFLQGWLPASLTESEAGLLTLALGLLVTVAVLTQLRDFANGLLTA